MGEDLAEQIAGPGAQLLARIHQGDGLGQVAGAGGVGAIQVGQPVLHHRGGQPQELEARIDRRLAAEPLDQQVGGGVVAHPDHLSGSFVEGKAAAGRLGSHPAGTATHQLLGEAQRFIPAQLAAVEIFQGGQQDRRFDRTGRRQGDVGLELGVAAVIEHQQEAARGQPLLGCRQGFPGLAEAAELPPRFEAARGEAAAGCHPRVGIHFRNPHRSLGQAWRQHLEAGADDHPQAHPHHEKTQQQQQGLGPGITAGTGWTAGAHGAGQG